MDINLSLLYRPFRSLFFFLAIPQMQSSSLNDVEMAKLKVS